MGEGQREAEVLVWVWGARPDPQRGPVSRVGVGGAASERRRCLLMATERLGRALLAGVKRRRKPEASAEKLSLERRAAHGAAAG